MSEGTAVVAAALIALVASLASLLLTARAGRKGEERQAHRRLLEPTLVDLGEAIHTVIASATVHFQKTRGGQDARTWLDRGNAAADDLRKVRPRLKYILFGVDEPLRTLTRLPDWTATFKGDDSGAPFIDRARHLGLLVDRAIARSYARGRPPNTLERWRLRRANGALRKSWNSRFPERPSLHETEDPVSAPPKLSRSTHGD